MEIDFNGGNGHGTELGAVVRLSLVVAEEGALPQRLRPTAQAASNQEPRVHAPSTA